MVYMADDTPDPPAKKPRSAQRRKFRSESDLALTDAAKRNADLYQFAESPAARAASESPGSTSGTRPASTSTTSATCGRPTSGPTRCS